MGLSLFQWFQVIAWTVSALGAVGVFLWGRGRSEAAYDERMKSVERTVAKAGEHTSELTSYVQGLTTRTETAELGAGLHEVRQDVIRIRERLATLEARSKQ